MSNVTSTSLTMVESCFLFCLGAVGFALLLSLIFYWITTIFGKGDEQDDWNNMEK